MQRSRNLIAGRNSVIAGIFLAMTFVQEASAQRTPATPHEVFAFCHDTHDARKRDLSEQAQLLNKLSYDGVGHVGLDKLDERIKSLDEAGLKLYLAGVTINLKKDFDEQLRPVREALPQLKGRGTVIYTVVTGLPPGAAEGMDGAVTALRKLSEFAASADVRIGIYPHTGDWVATVPQAVALAHQVDRDNCGVIFNLCHFLRNEPLESLDTVLQQAAPHLVALTINGADLAGLGDKDWKRLIQPLDQGSFSLESFLKKLDRQGYSGPIGIMCYGIGGDAELHLTRSINKWRELTK